MTRFLAGIRIIQDKGWQLARKLIRLMVCTSRCFKLRYLQILMGMSDGMALREKEMIMVMMVMLLVVVVRMVWIVIVISTVVMVIMVVMVVMGMVPRVMVMVIVEWHFVL